MSEESQLLEESLDHQRRHVLGILDGLSEEQLRQSILPSRWSCLAMVKHLALEVEHYWFRCIIDGEPLDFFKEAANISGAVWKADPDESAEDVFNLYRSEVERSSAIIATTPLEAAPKVRDDWMTNSDATNVRSIVLHVITETACHAGHLDAARELIDSRQWLVL